MKKENIKQTSAQLAAKQYLELYADERESITKDSIYEWWGQTKDQYDDVDYEAVEKEILSKI